MHTDTHIYQIDLLQLIVIIVYLEKLKRKKGGVYYEKLLIDALKFEGREAKNTIVIIREEGILEEDLPASLRNKLHLNMSNKNNFEKNTITLINHIMGREKKRK